MTTLAQLTAQHDMLTKKIAEGKLSIDEVIAESNKLAERYQAFADDQAAIAEAANEEACNLRAYADDTEYARLVDC